MTFCTVVFGEVLQQHRFFYVGLCRKDFKLFQRSLTSNHSLRIQVCPVCPKNPGLGSLHSYSDGMGLEPENSYSIGRGLDS